MTETDLAAAVKAAVDQWTQATPAADRHAALSNPAALSAALGLTVEMLLVGQGHPSGAGRAYALGAPCCHLKGVFDAALLVDTPVVFFPVPDTDGTMAGQAAALALHGLLQLETVSYGSENEGNLFVNLVAMPGTGAFAEKSKRSMRGHTDAVSFPIRGDDDPEDRRIAPSPDFVTLVGLRNRKGVPTTLMQLEDVLPLLSPDDIEELKKPQYAIRAQRTFRQGTRQILGAEHLVVDASVLKDTGAGIVVRYSHSNVTPLTEGGAAERASNHLEAACNRAARPVVVLPGDILLVNNRLALHGRGEVGGDVGGQSRWLLRTYGLDTSGLMPHKRHLGVRPPHVLFP